MGGGLFTKEMGKRCVLCFESHQGRCNYDRLVKIVHTLRTNVAALMKTNKEVVDIAKEFQSVIVEAEKEVIRLSAVEVKYKELTNGTAKLQSVTGEHKEIQQPQAHRLDVRHEVGIVSGPISTGQL